MTATPMPRDVPRETHTTPYVSTTATHDALWSEDAERAVLAAMLISPVQAAVIARELQDSHFYRGAHRALFQAMRALLAADVVIDPVTLANQLQAAGRLEAAGGKEAIGGLYDEIPTADHAAHHVGILRDFAARRETVQLAAQLARSARDLSVPLQATLDAGSRAMLRQVSGTGEQGFRPIKAGVWDAVSRIEQRQAGTAPVGLASGWPELDDRLHGGIEPGSLVVVVGVPSSGKTSLVWNLLCNVAVESGAATAMVSAEMKEEMLIESAFAAHGDIARQHIKTGDLERDEIAKLARAAGTLAQAPIWIDDTVMPDVEDVVNRCVLLKTQRPDLCAVGVDFIQLLQLRDKDRGELHETTLRKIAYQLKGLALRLNIVVFALAQPNDKQIEDRPDKRPQLRDIQGSSGIRQAADVIGLIYRDGLYNSSSNDPTLEVNLAKNKFGPTGLAKLTWEGSYVRVTSPRRRQLELEAERARNTPLNLLETGGHAE